MTRVRLSAVIVLTVAAWAAAVAAIDGLRPAALYRQRTGEGMALFGVFLLWLLSSLLGLGAAWMVPAGPARRRRGLVSAALLGPVLASVLGFYVSQLDLSHCWRTCAPFPR